MKSVVIILCAIVGLSLGLPETSAPYPAKGWKPHKAQLELPGRKYGTPRNADDVQITTAANEYLTPTTTQREIITQRDDNDVLSVQGLPSADAASQFRNYQAQARQQAAAAPAFVGHPLLLSPQFAPVNERLQERQFGQQQQIQTNEDPKNDAQQLPARAYGPPQPNDFPVTRDDQEQPQNDADDNGEDEDESDEPAIAVSNVVSGDVVQGQVGQYYILLPDSSLQKVRFATKQTEEDREINGFSAQLR